MIPRSGTSLRQARVDCGLSASGGLRGISEFNLRVGGTCDRLSQLRGTMMAMQPISRTTQVSDYRDNLNPGASCRRNWNEANIWSETDHKASLYTSNGNPAGTPAGVPAATCIHWTGYGDGKNDILAGYTVVGDAVDDPGTYNFEYKMQQEASDPYAKSLIEIIGWPSGFFVGTPNYYYSENWLGNRIEDRTRSINISASEPYITFTCLSVSGGGGSRGYMYFAKLRAYKA